MDEPIPVVGQLPWLGLSIASMMSNHCDGEHYDEFLNLNEGSPYSDLQNHLWEVIGHVIALLLMKMH